MMMWKAACLLMLVAGCVFQSGCATIICTEMQQITFTSQPEGARVRIDGMPMGVTPASVSLKTKRPHTVIFEKEGFGPYQSTLKRKVNGWTFGNIIFGGVIGFIVDAITGANFRLHPEQLHADLEPIGEQL